MKRVPCLQLTGSLALSMFLCLPAQAQEKLPYRNPALPVEQRVADLLARMTLEEKIAQLGGTWQNRNIEHDETLFFVGKNREFLPDRAAVLLQDGLGGMSRPKKEALNAW